MTIVSQENTDVTLLFAYCSNSHFCTNTHNLAIPWHLVEEFFTTYRASTVDHQQHGYICSPQSNPAERLNANSLPRNWIAFDQDGYISTEELDALKAFFSDLKCISYETRKSTPGAHRARFIVITDRPTTTEERRHLAPIIHASAPIKHGWDMACHNSAQQPIYLAPPDKEIHVYNGRLLPVNAILEIFPIPVKPAPAPRPQHLPDHSGDALAFLSRHGYVIKEDAEGAILRCPWGHLHTETELGAKYFYPTAENNWAGGFHCFHAHCEGRTIKDVFQFMKG